MAGIFNLVAKAIIWGSTAYFGAKTIKSVGDNIASVSRDNVAEKAIEAGIVNDTSDFKDFMKKFVMTTDNDGYDKIDMLKVTGLLTLIAVAGGYVFVKKGGK